MAAAVLHCCVHPRLPPLLLCAAALLPVVRRPHGCRCLYPCPTTGKTSTARPVGAWITQTVLVSCAGMWQVWTGSPAGCRASTPPPLLRSCAAALLHMLCRSRALGSRWTTGTCQTGSCPTTAPGPAPMCLAGSAYAWRRAAGGAPTTGARLLAAGTPASSPYIPPRMPPAAGLPPPTQTPLPCTLSPAAGGIMSCSMIQAPPQTATCRPPPLRAWRRRYVLLAAGQPGRAAAPKPAAPATQCPAHPVLGPTHAGAAVRSDCPGVLRPPRSHQLPAHCRAVGGAGAAGARRRTCTHAAWPGPCRAP